MSAQRIIMFKSYESTKTTIFKTWKSHDDLSRFLSTTFLGSLVMHFSKNFLSVSGDFEHFWFFT